jgi:hypothetical protein
LSGTTSLFAAFNIADGTAISQPHRQHRAVEFRTILNAIDTTVPADLDVPTVVCLPHRPPARLQKTIAKLQAGIRR